MASNRVFEAQGLTTNGIQVGGLSRLQFDAAYRDVIISRADGAIGSDAVDRAGLSAGVTLDCSDVVQAAAILDAASAATEFSGRESGAATYQKSTVAGIVWGDMTLQLPKNADGTLQLRGRAPFADGTKKLADLITVLGAQVAPVTVFPVSLYRPHSASFNPGVAIAPKHLESLSLSLSAEFLEDYGDDDIGMTSVDRGGLGPLQVTMVLKDASIVTGSDRASQLIDAGRGVLTCTLLTRGSAATKALTINNLLWTSVSKEQGRDYWRFTLQGTAGWRDADATPTPKVYSLTGADKLFAFV